MIGISKLTADKYCAKVMHVIFDEIPEFLWLFEAILFETIFH